MKKTMGQIISENRKAKGMTQLELAEKLGITDKAVSKWERDLSCPDLASIPRLADTLGISVEELMQLDKKSSASGKSASGLLYTVLSGVTLAMGIAVVVLYSLGELQVNEGITLLGLGTACAGASLLCRQ